MNDNKRKREIKIADDIRKMGRESRVIMATKKARRVRNSRAGSRKSKALESKVMGEQRCSLNHVIPLYLPSTAQAALITTRKY